MAKIAFSDVKLRSIRPPVRGQVSYWDDKLPAFGLRVSQAGTKTFILNRHNTFITLGRFGILSLSEARTEAKRMLAEFTLGKIRPQSITYPQAVKLFVEDKARSRRKSTADGYKWLLERFPFKGQLSDITHADLARTLKGIRSRSTYDHALVAARIFFNWAIKRRYLTENPTFGISPHGTPKRARVLSDQELAAIWLACEKARSESVKSSPDASDGDDVLALPGSYCTIVQLLILTGQRRGEIAGLRTSYLDGSIVTLPSALTKNHREHLFPLPALAAAILSQVEVEATANDALFFPARGKTHRPFNGWSKSKKALDELSRVAKWTLHDLRRTFRTNLARLGVAPHVAERLVNHVSHRSDVEQVYDHYRYLPEMRAAIEKWEAHVSAILAQESAPQIAKAA
jgi:integrase